MKTIIEMAREAGFEEIKSHKWTGYTNHLKSLIELVRADEREACAKVCDELANASKPAYVGMAATFCAAAIRARGNT